MSRQLPRAVLFDLGNTLVSYYKPADFAPILRSIVDNLSSYLARYGSRHEAAAAFEQALTLNAERSDLCVHPLALRLQSIFQLDDAFIALHGPELTRLFLAPIFATARLDPDALPLLVELRARGFMTGIISNTPWGSPAFNWNRELARHRLDRVTDTVVFCVECGKRKPDAHIFNYALERLGVAAKDAVFVGDDARWDVFGARNVGMRAVLLDPSGKEDVDEGGERIRSLKELLPLLERGA